ncbi:hypothetical protein BJX70DRAFT_399167 [Aspergillus crustosus]
MPLHNSHSIAMKKQLFKDFETAIQTEIFDQIPAILSNRLVPIFKELLQKLLDATLAVKCLEISSLSQAQPFRFFKLDTKDGGTWDPQTIAGFQERTVLPFYIKYGVWEEQRNVQSDDGTSKAYMAVRDREPDLKRVVIGPAPELLWESVIDEKYVGLHGAATWAVWYDESDELGTNLLIVMTKSGEIWDERRKCLGCLEVLHRKRQRRGGCDTTMYGLATDGDNYYFMKIEEAEASAESGISLVYEVDRLVWDKDSVLIWSIYRSLVRVGAKSPRNTSE